MSKKIIYMFIMLLCMTSLYAEKMPIAIMDLDAIEVPKATALAVSDLIRTELFNTGLFRVFERGEMEKILKEQQFGQTGLSDVESAVKIGKLLSAKKILVGTVSKLGQSYIVNARIIDVEKGEMEFADKAKTQSESDLDQAVETFARKIAARIQAKAKGQDVVKEYVMPTEESQTSSVKSGGGLRLKTTGFILSGVGVVTGVMAFISNGKLKKDYDHYLGLKEEDTVGWTKEKWDAEWNTVLDSQKKRDMWRGFAILTGGLGVLCLTVDYLFLRPNQQTAFLDTKHNWNFAFNDGYRMEYTYRW